MLDGVHCAFRQYSVAHKNWKRKINFILLSYTGKMHGSSIGGMFYSSFLGGNLIKVEGNKLTSLTS